MLNRKGQSTLEYAIIVAVIVAGLLAMQFYIKRGWEGKLRAASDNMGEQFDPGAYTANFNIASTNAQSADLVAGQTTTTHTANAVNTKTGNDNVAAWNPNQNVYGQ
jgi:uncharacterized protein (UPF0333 family)